MRVRCEQTDTIVWHIILSASPGEDAKDAAYSLDSQGLAQLEEALTNVAASRLCRVLVISSEGAKDGVFCRGMDLGRLVNMRAEQPSRPDDARVAVERDLGRYAACIARMRRLGKTVVCVIDGEAVGGGVGLVAAADLVLAGPNASFVLPELFLGFVPAMVLPVLRDRISNQKIRWMCLTGARLDAARAQTLGLVDERTDDSDGVDKALRGLLRTNLRASPAAIRRLKGLMTEIESQPLRAALDVGHARTAADTEDPHTLAAIRGFLDGETPPWFARVPKAKPEETSR